MVDVREENEACRRPEVLVIESEGCRIDSLSGMLLATDDSVGVRKSAAGVCSIPDLASLAETPLDGVRLVICSMHLQDGTGMDALMYLRCVNPLLPVILVVDQFDRALVAESVRAGAMDCVIRDDTLAQRLPVVIERCFAQHALLQETERLQRQLNSSLSELVDEVMELSSVVSSLEHAATTDELTGLHNRRHLNRALDQCFNDRRRPHDNIADSIAFLMIDVDQFKAVNDHLGHQAGDALLFLLARVLNENCRAGDTLARWGGDEFCVLMPDCSPEEAVQAARRMVNAFAESSAGFFAQGLKVGLSIGVSHSELTRALHPSQLVAHADEAMYKAKRGGVSVHMHAS